jgi:hypothetical protein
MKAVEIAKVELQRLKDFGLPSDSKGWSAIQICHLTALCEAIVDAEPLIQESCAYLRYEYPSTESEKYTSWLDKHAKGEG